ncbi:t-SNARE [Anaeromyces robustus]|uniref:t-SNARE n=1 Tax=Anaeromyces robustus TaxID=1754192 RepID=A0A1Y1WSP2_9FUNG|nr:t-SNARE [Anaeromyces robustus]|eukprot:ORX76318.1 t-SNARE [Anaeromyces robustus]
MYRDRLTELRAGNSRYNQSNDRQYSGYNSSYNYGGGYSNDNSNNYNSYSHNYGGAYSRDNEYDTQPDSQGYSRNTSNNSIASQYSGRINNINNDINGIWDYIDRLDSLYRKNYNEVRRTEETENIKRIAELEERVTAEIQNITNQLKRIKAEAERISNPRDKKMVLGQVNNSSNNLKKVFDSYNQKRTKNEEQGRNKMIRQYQIVNRNATQEEVERYVDSHPDGVLQHSLLGGSKAAYNEAQRRHDQMEQINQSINELCDLFQDMNNMLITQNEVINIIEENIDDVDYNVEVASKELTRAIEIRKSSRKKLWWITLIVTIILIIFVLWLYFAFRDVFDIIFGPFIKFFKWIISLFKSKDDQPPQTQTQ